MSINKVITAADATMLTDASANCIGLGGLNFCQE